MAEARASLELDRREGLTRGRCDICTELAGVASRIVILGEHAEFKGISPPRSSYIRRGEGLLHVASAWSGGFIERMVIEQHAQGNHRYDPYAE